jgi:hypothetical protein
LRLFWQTREAEITSLPLTETKETKKRKEVKLMQSEAEMENSDQVNGPLMATMETKRRKLHSMVNADSVRKLVICKDSAMTGRKRVPPVWMKKGFPTKPNMLIPLRKKTSLLWMRLAKVSEL